MNFLEIYRIYNLHQKWLESNHKEGEKADFSGHILSNHDFSHINLSYANFDGADLSECNFTCSNLSFCTFKKTNLSNSVFMGANLIEALLENANLKGAFFNDCIMPYPTPQGDLIAWMFSTQQYEKIKILIPKDAHRIRLLKRPEMGITHRIIPLEIKNNKTGQLLEFVEMFHPYWRLNKSICLKINEPFETMKYNPLLTDFTGGEGIKFYFEEPQLK